MENQITRLAIFDVIKINDWLFRMSVANNVNIMVMASNITIPDSFMIQFFVDVDIAKAWVDEVAAGKHI